MAERLEMKSRGQGQMLVPTVDGSPPTVAAANCTTKARLAGRRTDGPLCAACAHTV